MEDQSRPLLPLWFGPGAWSPRSPLSDPVLLPSPALTLVPESLLSGCGLCCQTGREEPPAALGPNPALQSLLPWRVPLPGWEGHPSCISLVPGPAWLPTCELGQLGAFRAPHHGAPSAGPACGDPGLSQSLEAFSNLSQSLGLNHPPLPSLDAFVPSSQGPDTMPRAPSLRGLLTLGELDCGSASWTLASGSGRGSKDPGQASMSAQSRHELRLRAADQLLCHWALGPTSRWGRREQAFALG